MGFATGQLVQELGWDEDADEDLRSAIMDEIGEDLIYDTVEAVDRVLLWWRTDDGDLADGLVDALTDLRDKGCIWLMTPKIGHPGYIDATDISESALTAGLALANPASVSPVWQAHKLVRPKASMR
jgi:hypothetical protein